MNELTFDDQSFFASDTAFYSAVQDSQPSDKPSILYHYSNRIALEGIVASRALWLTRSTATNDSIELKYGLTLAIEQLKNHFLLASSRSKGEYREEDVFQAGRVPPSTMLVEIALATLKQPDIENHLRYEYFLSCFTEAGDQLSQWRAYGDDAKGLAIGFSPDVIRNPSMLSLLSSDALGDTVDLLKVVYDRKEQVKLVDRIIASALLHSDKVIPTLPESMKKDAMISANTMLITSLVRLALFLKHPGFHEEAEWRLIHCKTKSGIDSCATVNPVRVRPSARGDVEYVELPLCGRSELLRIEHVVRGSKSSGSLDEILKSLATGGPIKGVGHSAIPYR